MSAGGPLWEKNDGDREAAFKELTAQIKIPELKKYTSMRYLMLFFSSEKEKRLKSMITMWYIGETEEHQRWTENLENDQREKEKPSCHTVAQKKE